MNFDAVFWGAILSVAGALVVLVVLAVKTVQKIKQDSERHPQP